MEELLPLALAAATAIPCGALVGYERQRLGKPLGMLTAILVVLGSALFVQAGALLFRAAGGDLARLPSMIASGIGFIGAGAIMRSRFSVSGLATAATIWALGGVGILVGSGHPVLVLAATGILFGVLRAVPKLEHVLFVQRFCLHADLVVEVGRLPEVIDRLVEHQIVPPPDAIEVRGERAVVALDQCGMETRPLLLHTLKGLDGVVEVLDRRRARQAAQR